MRGTRSLGLALIAATLGGVPAIAQQQNNPPNPSGTQATTADTQGANPAASPSGADKSANTAATTPGTGDNSSAATAGKSEANPAASPSGADKSANTAATTPAASDNSSAATAGKSGASTTTAANPPSDETKQASNNNGPGGTLQKYDNEWRSSKLVGATVWNSKGDKLGTIDDLLMGDGGKIDKAVIDVGGGVLGIGSKLVSVPFDQLKLEESKQNNNGSMRSTEAPAHTGTTTASNNSGNSATTPAPSGNAAANGSSHPTYYSIVLPDGSKDALNKQQEFKYAGNG